MNLRRITFLLVLGTITFGSVSLRAIRAQGPAQPPQSHIAWVSDTLTQMRAVKAGMNRSDLLKVFKTEGGLSTGLGRTFVSKDCPYFKVDVEFEAVGRPNRDRDGSVTLTEDGRDIITRISRPYLEFSVMD